MFLLAQLREPRAYAILIRLFSTPGEAVMDLAGDVVTESLGNLGRESPYQRTRSLRQLQGDAGIGGHR
jgi:hypothetical protein